MLVIKEDQLEEKLTKLYNDYLFNLKQMPFETEWIHPSELEVDKRTGTWDRHVKNDPFLREYNSEKLNLAKDILENGTYWPFNIYKDNGKNIVFEGVHRLDSINMAIKEGLWPEDKKVFCIITPSRDYMFYGAYVWDYNENELKRIENSLKKQLPEKIEMHLPICINPKGLSMFPKMYRKILTSQMNYIDEDIVRFYPETYYECYIAYFVYCILLRDKLHEYRKLTGKMIPTSSLINM